MDFITSYPAFPLSSDLAAFHVPDFDRSTYLRKFIEIIPARIRLVRNVISLDLVNPWDTRTVNGALGRISELLREHAEASTESPREVDASVERSSIEIPDSVIGDIRSRRTVLSANLDSFCIDCSILFMELLRGRNPRLYWGSISNSKNILHNYPLLLGLGKGWELQPLTFARRDVLRYVDRGEQIDWIAQFARLETIASASG